MRCTGFIRTSRKMWVSALRSADDARSLIRVQRKIRKTVNMHRLLLLCCVAAPFCFPQAAPLAPNTADSVYHTGGFSNGRSWKVRTWEERIVFVAAYGEGVLATLNTTCQTGTHSPDEKASHLMPDRLSRQDIVDSLNSFYAVAENAPIPIKDAIAVSAMRVEGMDETAIQAWISQVRLKSLKTP